MHTYIQCQGFVYYCKFEVIAAVIHHGSDNFVAFGLCEYRMETSATLYMLFWFILVGLSTLDIIIVLYGLPWIHGIF